MKRDTRKILGAVLLAIGVIGFLGLIGSEELTIPTAILCICLIAGGIALIVDSEKSKSRSKAAAINTLIFNTTNEQTDKKDENNNAADIDNEEEEYKKRREAYLSKKRIEFADELSAIPKVEISFSDIEIEKRLYSEMPEIHFSNITRSSVLEKIFPLVCVDVETTGLKSQTDDIVEVSAIKYDIGFKPVSCFTTLLKPRNPIPYTASRINNITDDMVKDCPSFSSISTDFFDS